jgi:hypothetical protein
MPTPSLEIASLPLPQAWIRRLDVLDALCDLLEWGQPIWAPPAP